MLDINIYTAGKSQMAVSHYKQNTATRIVADSNWIEHMPPVFKRLKVLPTENLYELYLGTFMFYQHVTANNYTIPNLLHNSE